MHRHTKTRESEYFLPKLNKVICTLLETQILFKKVLWLTALISLLCQWFIKPFCKGSMWDTIESNLSKEPKGQTAGAVLRGWFGLQSDACLSHMTIVCLHYCTLKWASSAGGRTGESFKGDRVSVWGDESLLEIGSGNDCTAKWREHAVLRRVVKMVSLLSRVRAR